MMLKPALRPPLRAPMRGATTLREGAGGWYDTDAILDADYANARFRWDGQTFTSEAAFNTAIGATKSSIQRTFGPYVGANSELILNGALTTDLTSWTSLLNGTSTASIVSAAARFVSDGTTGIGAGGAGISQAFTTVLAKAYRAVYDILTGTSGLRLGGTVEGAAGATGGTKSVANGNIDTWSADGTTSYFYVYRNGAGSGGADNISVKECVPFKNFTQGGVSVVITGTTPAAASGTKVLWSAGQYTNSGGGDPGDDIQIHYSAGGNLIVQAKYAGSTVASLDLGAVAVSTAFTVRAGFSANAFYAQLNNGISVTDTGGNMPGVAAMYINRNFGGNNWDGVVEPRVKVYAGGGAEQFYGLTSNAIHFDGDSFSAGAHSVVLPTTLQTLMSRAVYNTGAGGATMANISGRLAATSAAIKSKVNIIWDGDDTSGLSASAYADLVATGLSGISKFILIPQCVSRGQADVSVEAALLAEFQSRWPNNVIDWRTVLTMNGNVPADAMFFITDGSDDIHLSQAAMDLMAAAIQTFITGKGW